MKTKIYLVENCYGDPNKIYIGKTKTSRILSHKKTFGDNIKYTYIDEIYSLNRDNWEPLETFWIEQFRQWGFEVMNKRKKGGSGPEFHTEETKQKMKILKLGKPNNSKGIKRKPLSEEKKKNLRVPKLSKENYSYPKSKETKQKISQSKIKHTSYEDPKRGEKISKALKGYKQTEEHIKKRSAHLKGKSNLKNKKSKPDGFGQNISNKLKGGKRISIRKSILQYDLKGNFIKEWDSILEICNILFNDVSKNPNITACCKNRIKSAYGYIWKYKN